MKEYNKYRLVLYKKYLDTGLGVTNYFKYLIAFFGLASASVKWTMIIAFVYAVTCFFVGWGYFKYGWADTEQEVMNNYNPFVKYVKRKI